MFRFDGKLLGEGVFVRWLRSNSRRMIYRPVQQYRKRVEASHFLKAGRNPYPFVPSAKLTKIRLAASSFEDGPYPETGEILGITKHRVGQGKVRESALLRYEQRCCLCAIDDPSLLVAGHIKGWAKDATARSEPKNVLLMCAFHDSLFGRGFITIAPGTLNVLIAEKALSLGAYQQITRITKTFRRPIAHLPAREYLTWHRNNIFKERPGS